MKIFKVLTVVFFSTNFSFAQMNHQQMSSSAFSTDTRKPLPLTAMMADHQKQNMRGHLEAMRDLVEAFTEKNFKKIEEAGKKLGTSPQMAMMCEHMGKGAPGFTELAMKMHTSADEITKAGQKKNLKEAMLATSRTLKNCTTCHAMYKQEVMSEEDWKKTTEAK